MSDGRYTDDPLEDSCFRDDELRIQEELDKEIGERRNQKGNILGPVIMVVIVAVFLLWFFLG